MTFAAQVKTLLEDREIWKKFFTGKTPADFIAFTVLTGQDNLDEAKRLFKTGYGSVALVILNNFLSERKKRLLISPLPAFSTHTETAYLSPLINWSKV